MPKNVRYYITKADDQAVVRSVPVSRPRLAASEARRLDEPRLDAAAKPSVSSLLRLALRRKHDDTQRV